MNGLDAESEEVTVDVLDHSLPESQAAIAKHGFENHGIVLFDADGTVKKTMDGHQWTEAQIREAVRGVRSGT